MRLGFEGAAGAFGGRHQPSASPSATARCALGVGDAHPAPVFEMTTRTSPSSHSSEVESARQPPNFGSLSTCIG